MKGLDPTQLRGSAERHGLSLVVLFGSAARGAPRPADLDLAVMPDTPSSSGFLRLARAWPREFGRGDLDLAWLPTASPALWQEVSRSGIPLYEARPNLFRSLQLEALTRSWDSGLWRERNRDFVQRTLRGRFVLNQDLVSENLAALAGCLAKLREVLNVDRPGFLASFLHHHAGERLLELMVEHAAKINIEVGQAVAKTPPTDYYSSFFCLQQAGWISDEVARGLAEMASLRNVLVHRYQTVSLEDLYAELEKSLPLWVGYLESVQERL